MMKIKQINENDIEAILDLIIQYKQEQHSSPDSICIHNIKKQLLKLIKKNDPTAFICTLKNKVVGYMNTHICPFPLIGGSELYISDLLINQNFRGKGIGKLFLAKAEELAKINKCVRIMLNNQKDSPSYKRSFYSKNGFTERTNFATFVKQKEGVK